MMPVIGTRFLLRGMLSLEWRRYLTHMLLSLGDEDSTNKHGDICVSSLISFSAHWNLFLSFAAPHVFRKSRKHEPACAYSYYTCIAMIFHRTGRPPPYQSN